MPVALLPLLTLLHLGPLHPVEHVLVLLVAFGPFVVLGVVVAIQRRRAVAEEQREAEPGTGTSAP
ncbi:MAG: hypothetical protein WBQ50_01575 [Nocardioides sp.]